MEKQDLRNTIMFMVCALALWLAYNYFFLAPAQKKAEAEHAAQIAAAPAGAPAGAAATPAGPAFVTIDQALARPNVAIDTPALSGSIALKGGRFDDLDLKAFHETIDPKSARVRLLQPEGAADAYFAQFGWSGQNLTGMPDANTVWTAQSDGPLTPAHPVKLTYTNDQGLVFTRDILVDDQFMFTITDSVANHGTAPVTLTPYSAVQRDGLPPPQPRVRPSNDGVFSVLGTDKYLWKLRAYKAWAKDGQYAAPSNGGWIGLGDKYWLTALIPDQKEKIQTRFTAQPFGADKTFEIRYEGPARTLAPGGETSESRKMFAGAKREPVLSAYGRDLGIPRFVDAIDWGWYYFITKPLFYTIKWFQGFVGNFGVALLMLTVVIKLAFFYPANMSFESMTKMKKIQPQMEKLKARFKDDPAAQQQATMKLYKDEKINPLLGCLPMLATIPVFLGLIKVLYTTIEMRQAPFYGWIHDLSDRDPTSILTLFGLIHWDPSAVPLIGSFLDGPLHLGVWPLLYGLTMWLTQSMSPPAADPTQQAIMKWIPIFFTFIMSSLPAGLIIYYCWSNSLTIIQQYVIMRRFKTDNPIDGIIRRITGKPNPAA